MIYCKCTLKRESGLRPEMMASPTHPFCFNCGYNLSGLQLPQPCPECGRLADPEAETALAREWFARRSSILEWLVRPRTLPSGLWYSLSNDESVKLAGRREARWLWLPVILTFLTVAVGCLVTVEYNVKVWHYDGADPDRRPRSVHYETESDRLFAFDLHLFRGGIWAAVFKKPFSWVEVTERKRMGFGVSVPEYSEPMFLILGCSPLLAVAFGYWPSKKLAFVWSRSRARRLNRDDLPRAIKTASSVIAAPLGTALWLWFVATVSFATWQLCAWDDEILVVVPVMFFAAAGMWALVCLVGYGILARQDRARLVVGSRFALWAVAFILGIGGPTAAGWGLTFLF